MLWANRAECIPPYKGKLKWNQGPDFDQKGDVLTMELNTKYKTLSYHVNGRSDDNVKFINVNLENKIFHSAISTEYIGNSIKLMHFEKSPIPL